MRERATPSGVCRTVVGFDLGTTTAWAIMDVVNGTGSLRNFGSIEIARGKFEGGGIQMIKLDDAIGKVLALARKRDDKLFVAFEMTRFFGPNAGPDAPQQFGAFSMKLMEVCDRAMVPYEGLAPNTILAHATGYGKAPKGTRKKLLRDAMEERYGVKFKAKKFDDSDAVATADAFARKMGWLANLRNDR